MYYYLRFFIKALKKEDDTLIKFFSFVILDAYRLFILMKFFSIKKSLIG